MATMATIFSIRTILAIFDLQVTPMLPTKFRVIWHLGLGEEAKKKMAKHRSTWTKWFSSIYKATLISQIESEYHDFQLAARESYVGVGKW